MGNNAFIMKNSFFDLFLVKKLETLVNICSVQMFLKNCFKKIKISENKNVEKYQEQKHKIRYVWVT